MAKKKVVRVTAVVKNGQVVGTRQTNKKTGFMNAVISAVAGKPGGKK